MRAGARYWTSAMATNVAIAAALALIIWFGGLMPVLMVFLPTSILAGAAGVWLFYIQHQFEEAYWDKDTDWDLHDAALHGSSHYDLPAVLRWMTANIGIHHVHHLYSRIPFYRLTEVLRDHRDLAQAQRMTLRESFECAKLHLWDARERRLLSFSQAKMLYGPSLESRRKLLAQNKNPASCGVFCLLSQGSEDQPRERRPPRRPEAAPDWLDEASAKLMPSLTASSTRRT